MAQQKYGNLASDCGSLCTGCPTEQLCPGQSTSTIQSLFHIVNEVLKLMFKWLLVFSDQDIKVHKEHLIGLFIALHFQLLWRK